MAKCECLEKCPFFNDKMQDTPATANMMKSKYCLGNFEECARYMVFKALGREKVPTNLFPNMRDKAKAIIAEG